MPHTGLISSSIYDSPLTIKKDAHVHGIVLLMFDASWKKQNKKNLA